MTDISRFPLNSAEHEQEVTNLLCLVGSQVHRRRKELGLPRRVLSEISGVSPRYIAQIEAGEGNISIALLQRVALAMNCGIKDLLGHRPSDVKGIAALFHAADETTQGAEMRQLTTPSTSHQKAARICLIGLRGAGKSTLGARISETLDAPFVELNKEIEEQCGMPLGEVMALYGQEGYRGLESRALERVIAKHERVILAVGGGLVEEAKTYATLLAHFHTIWIRTSPQEHMSRVRDQGDERPMAGNPQAMDQLKSILAAREILYARSDAQINTSGKRVGVSEKELADLIQENGYLNTQPVEV